MHVLCRADVCNVETSELMHMTLKLELKHLTSTSDLKQKCKGGDADWGIMPVAQMST